MTEINFFWHVLLSSDCQKSQVSDKKWRFLTNTKQFLCQLIYLLIQFVKYENQKNE